MNVYPFSFVKDTPAISYVTVLGNNPIGGTTSTYNGSSIGGPGFIVVGVMGANDGVAANNYTATVTIGGVSATNLISTGNNIAYSGLFGRTVNAGTTANIVVTFNQGIETAGIGIWRVTGLNSETPVTTTSNAFSSRNSFTLTVTPTGRNQIYIAQTTSETAESQTYSPNIRNYTNNRGIDGNQAGGSTTMTATTNYVLTVTTGTATTGQMGGVAVLLR